MWLCHSFSLVKGLNLFFIFMVECGKTRVCGSSDIVTASATDFAVCCCLLASVHSALWHLDNIMVKYFLQLSDCVLFVSFLQQFHLTVWMDGYHDKEHIYLCVSFSFKGHRISSLPLAAHLTIQVQSIFLFTVFPISNRMLYNVFESRLKSS